MVLAIRTRSLPRTSTFSITNVICRNQHDCGYIGFMSSGTGTGTSKYRCAQCEQPEDRCDCEKYCCLCQSVIDVRICSDGLMYCEPCRTACEYKTSD
jgi:hypothetical protein